MDELKASPSKLSQLGTSLRRGMGRAINEGFVHDMLNISNILRGIPEVPSKYDRPQSVMREELPAAPEAIGRSIGRYLGDPENLVNLIADPSNLVGLKTLKSLKPAVRALTSPLGALAAGTAYASDADAGPLSRLARHLAADSEPVKKGIANIIKPRGGQWLTGNLDRQLNNMKKVPPGENFLSEMARIGVPEGQAQAYIDQTHALNQWIDGPLRKYVIRDMGSESDPLRKLAETHPIHSSSLENPLVPSDYDTGMTKLGQSRRAKQWENWVDSEIFPLKAADVKSSTIDRYPWVAKLPDDETLWNISSNTLDGLEFPHMVDEIANSLAAGEISPESLRNGSFSVEAAARHIGAKAEASRKAASKVEQDTLRQNLMNTPHKQYENGYRWVELRDTSSPEAMKACTAIGKQGGWCTQQDWAAEEYGSKGSKLYALLDPDGKPHAQVQVANRNSLSDFSDEFESLLDNLGEGIYDDFVSIADSKGDIEAMRFLANQDDPVVREGAQKILDKMSTNKPSILQIKPMENDWDSKRVADLMQKDPEYKKKLLPMLRDFVQSGDWGGVMDLENVGLVPHNGKYVDPKVDKIYQMTRDEGGSFPHEISDRFLKPHEYRDLGFDLSQPHSIQDLYEFTRNNRDKVRELRMKSVEDFYSDPENARFANRPQYRDQDIQAVTDDLLDLDQDFDTWWESSRK